MSTIQPESLSEGHTWPAPIPILHYAGDPRVEKLLSHSAHQLEADSNRLLKEIGAGRGLNEEYCIQLATEYGLLRMALSVLSRNSYYSTSVSPS